MPRKPRATPPFLSIIKSTYRQLGPGLITGASDDDPSGIATYSQVGAQFGFGLLWTMLFSFPLMAAIQEICARIGRVTGTGISGNIRRHYPRPLLFGVLALLVAANVFNLGADIGAMAAALQLLAPGPTEVYVVFFGLVCLVLLVFIPYTKYVNYLKWLTLVLFAYVAALFSLEVPWSQVFRATVLPSITFHADYFMALVGVLGTTISPYLFFWQASQEVEEVESHARQKPLREAPQQARTQIHRMRVDTYIGMAVSNLVAYSIIVTSALTLYAHGQRNIQSAAQAAEALKPLAGNFAFLLFTLGIIGTGLLAVPVLAGSAAYGVSEAMGWRASLERRPLAARGFYATITVATLIGLALNLLKLDPIKALFWSAVFNGVAAVPLLAVIMFMAGNSKIMGKFTLPLWLGVLGWTTTIVMIAASVGFFITLKM
ncbi:MAG: divalent metal cation transporter [Acidipila sp.]|nr:divalent metal cation transporter [Acidipila sp.]